MWKVLKVFVFFFCDPREIEHFHVFYGSVVSYTWKYSVFCPSESTLQSSLFSLPLESDL